MRGSLDERVEVLLNGGHHERDALFVLAGDLLSAVEIHLSSAPAASLAPSFGHTKPTSSAPSCVPNDCECRCKSPGDHARRELEYAVTKDLAHVEAWCIASFFLLRPHPARAAKRDEIGVEFEKRVVSMYVYLAPELAAAAESAVNPGTNAEQIRRVRKANDRHRQTGARVPAQEKKAEEAVRLRGLGDTVEQVAAQLDCSVSSVEKWTRSGRRRVESLRLAA